ncbi:N-acetylglucosamine/diacetylchitobiose ABC transporter substrate-binding protein [Microtetraspora sp. NBRC 16547]|uniref:N-acetylglucosamine/diacetylchitobiose ABC transporter substrate-binding protein n=1 Tax=Microtetraspora sp. NBRC 16547 TaxID=3030993 RepID=UPI0024A5A1D0|nr:N-acetylglucosamine/diacetylchitobiose ABC transporter substrate-binding protein [Microtetraspora sp. NBRC 16547]GLX02330.1 carbohydrate ABC transporter, N-acetylglucosamine/diacetylchitobiose-binding protein [Microtetraspora sp. NBRC 16547]
MTNPPSLQTRRELFRRAAVAALLAGPAGGLLSACAIGSGSDPGPGSQGTDATLRAAAGAGNPLGVPPDKPLEIVIFKGGYSDEYAKFDEELYRKRFPEARITHRGIQQVGQVMQPRFVAGDPPDIIDNTGAGRLEISVLSADRQLRDLRELLDAPSIDDPATKIRDILLPGVVEDGTMDGVFCVLNYVYTVYGIWYSKPFFEKNGWEYPQTWDAMLALCAEIKKSGLAPWTYQGKYPEYMNDPLFMLAAKAGGMELIKAIDNLEPNAWQSDAMKGAVEAIYELAARGYFLKGSEGLSHTEAQTAWVQGKAAFIPCGSWLESEQKSVTPAGFDMVVGATPRLSSSDKMPVTATQGGSGESFIVPAMAKNPYGAMEFLRIMLSKEAARRFAELASALPTVAGATEGLTLSSGLSSVRDMVAAAGDDVFIYKFGGWYPTIGKAASTATGELLTRRITPADWIKRLQKAADDVARDSSIPKYER